MLDIAVRLMAAWMADPINGVNVLAQGLPRVTLTPGKVDDAPPIVALCNDSEDESVARDLDPADVPALMIWGDSTVDVDLKGYNIAKEVILAAAYVTSEDADPISSIRDSGYIFRAGVLSLGRFNSQERSAAYRELNGVRIMKVTSVIEQRVTAAVGRRKMWGFLKINCIVADTLQ